MSPSVIKTISTVCFVAGFLSIAASIAIWTFYKGGDPAHAERFGIFVGLWAPTLLILSNRFDRYADKARPVPGLQEDASSES